MEQISSILCAYTAQKLSYSCLGPVALQRRTRRHSIVECRLDTRTNVYNEMSGRGANSRAQFNFHPVLLQAIHLLLSKARPLTSGIRGKLGITGNSSPFLLMARGQGGHRPL